MRRFEWVCLLWVDGWVGGWWVAYHFLHLSFELSHHCIDVACGWVGGWVGGLDRGEGGSLNV